MVEIEALFDKRSGNLTGLDVYTKYVDAGRTFTEEEISTVCSYIPKAKRCKLFGRYTNHSTPTIPLSALQIQLGFFIWSDYSVDRDIVTQDKQYFEMIGQSFGMGAPNMGANMLLGRVDPVPAKKAYHAVLKKGLAPGLYMESPDNRRRLRIESRPVEKGMIAHNKLYIGAGGASNTQRLPDEHVDEMNAVIAGYHNTDLDRLEMQIFGHSAKETVTVKPMDDWEDRLRKRLGLWNPEIKDYTQHIPL